MKLDPFKLKRAIASKGYANQYEYARLAGCSAFTLSRIIQGADFGIKPHMLGKLAQALDCQPEDLLRARFV